MQVNKKHHEKEKTEDELNFIYLHCNLFNLLVVVCYKQIVCSRMWIFCALGNQKKTENKTTTAANTKKNWRCEILNSQWLKLTSFHITKLERCMKLKWELSLLLEKKKKKSLWVCSGSTSIALSSIEASASDTYYIYVQRQKPYTFNLFTCLFVTAHGICLWNLESKFAN